ncbi:hypothetical protein Tcan_02294 [Toxocara canis]|uniref:Uncharacterized protein n=1 Tax=Toxocara canis TaxID=6265 RepID=A0A0B2UPU5_TOXCA|nr:hypothetical protein Tcan_02294 [Toxocara canis]
MWSWVIPLMTALVFYCSLVLIWVVRVPTYDLALSQFLWVKWDAWCRASQHAFHLSMGFIQGSPINSA